VRAFVMTRARRRRAEYRFLGASPRDEGWWRDYAALTQFEEPSLILERVEEGWRFFVSGIPSARVESTGTTVRFSLAAESELGGGDDADAIVSVVESWLAGNGELGRRLDEKFPEELVTQAYEPESRPEYEHDVRDRLSRVLAELPPPAAGATGYRGSWVAAESSAEGRAALSARCRRVVAGGSSLAAVFNTAQADDLRELAANGEVAALIFDGPVTPTCIEYLAGEPEPPGKVQGQGLTMRMKQTLATRKGKLTAGGTGATLLAVAVMLLIVIGPL
jgi:hypothetical protein